VTAVRTRLGAGAGAALLVAALLTAVTTAVAPSAGADGGGFVSSINSARASAGLPPLASRGDLASVAASWAQQMASSGELAHNPGLRGQVSGWRYVGENVGVGPTVGDVHAAFMGSSAHRANILDTDYTEVGVGTAEAGGRIWVAEVFRAPTGSSPAPAAAPSGGRSQGGGAAASGGSSRASGSSGSSSSGASGSSGAGRSAGRSSRPLAPPPPPPPTPEQLAQQRASAAAAGPGAAPAATPVAQALRFAGVMRAAHS